MSTAYYEVTGKWLSGEGQPLNSSHVISTAHARTLKSLKLIFYNWHKFNQVKRIVVYIIFKIICEVSIELSASVTIYPPRKSAAKSRSNSKNVHFSNINSWWKSIRILYSLISCFLWLRSMFLCGHFGSFIKNSHLKVKLHQSNWQSCLLTETNLDQVW